MIIYYNRDPSATSLKNLAEVIALIYINLANYKKKRVAAVHAYVQSPNTCQLIDIPFQVFFLLPIQLPYMTIVITCLDWPASTDPS